ncbi:classical arabinogalactan protein 4-like [Malania oleifera]|uniref:classical arabinogalactan protein 4-like n=1 Tax=Malania oleifera TaxID=397392 RepID=UPI0025AE8B0E|nr:classical arabinogalactan protein 4-like [Malania oleifera]
MIDVESFGESAAAAPTKEIPLSDSTTMGEAQSPRITVSGDDTTYPSPSCSMPQVAELFSSLAASGAATSFVPPPSVPPRAPTPLVATVLRPPVLAPTPTQAPTVHVSPPAPASPESPVVSGSFSEEEATSSP